MRSRRGWPTGAMRPSSCSRRISSARSMRRRAAKASIKASGTLLIGVTAEAIALAALATPGVVGRRHRGGRRPVVRQRDGLRRSARRVHRDDDRTVAPDSGPARGPHRRQGRAHRRTCSRCRRASNTSGARKPPRTSAPIRRIARSVATIYLAAIGKTGLRDSPRTTSPARASSQARASPPSTGCGPLRRAGLQRVRLRVPGRAADVSPRLRGRNIIGGSTSAASIPNSPTAS